MFTHCLNSTKIARYCRALIGFGLRRKSRVLWRWIFGVLAKCYLSLGVSVYSGVSVCLTIYCRLLNVRLDFHDVVLVECCLERSSWLLNPLWERTEYAYVKLVILESVIVGCFAYG
jgi:hypothetical protein